MEVNLVFVLSFLAIICSSSCETPLVVETLDGTLRGTYLSSVNGKTFRAFMSIPFAEPPIGPLRFKAPIKAKPWEGERDASKDAPICIQNNPYVRMDQISGQEDCLYLNVYAPKNAHLLPVMVFLHGGGWVCGSGNKEFYGPERLLDRDVILVGVNYRLSILGLFSTMDEAAPGNWALKDQRMALEWVQKNIMFFGGDHSRVTLFGESAGGASAHYHMMSPKSKGLFHRAILQSGTAQCTWAYSHPGKTEENAKILGKIMRCPLYDNKALVECLRTKTAEELIAAGSSFFEWDYDPMIPFRPVIEPMNDDSFLTEDPRKVMEENRLHDVSVMIGWNENEGAIRSASIFGVPGLLEEFMDNFDRIAPITFHYDRSKYSKELTSAIKEYYFSSDLSNFKQNLTTINDQCIDKLLLMECERMHCNEVHTTSSSFVYSDALFLAGIYETLNILKETDIASKVFLYKFTYRAKNSFSQIFGDPHGDYGACHVDELLHLFNIKLFPGLNEDDSRISNKMLDIWTDFALNARVLDQKACDHSTSHMDILEIGNSLKTNSLSARAWENMPVWNVNRKLRDRNEL